MRSGWQTYQLLDNGQDYAVLDWPVSAYHGVLGAAVSAAPGNPSGLPRLLLSLRRAGSLTREESGPNPARRDWLAKLGFDYRSSLSLPLVHSRKVVYARSSNDLTGCQGDGVVSDNPASHIVLTVADCMPIFMYDPLSTAFALLHSGWQGTGILEDACAFFADRFNAKLESLLVVFGPHIGSCCYTVDAGRADLFAGRFGSSAVEQRDDTSRLHLLNANLAMAEHLGIRHLAYTGTCTSCSDFLGSYRREGAAAFTRMAALIGYPCSGAN